MKKKNVAQRKKEQGYAIGIRQCHDCLNCEVATTKHSGPFGGWTTRTYFCKIGDFTVKKTGTCNEGKWK